MYLKVLLSINEIQILREENTFWFQKLSMFVLKFNETVALKPLYNQP